MKTKTTIYFLVVVFVFMISMSSGASIDHFRYIATYGSGGHEDHQLNFPKGLAFSPDQRLLAITDTENNRVLVFSVTRPILENGYPVGSSPLKLELVLGDIWPWEGSIEPHDPPDRYREKDHFDGLKPRRELHGRAYHGGQARARPPEKIPIDRFHHPQGITWRDDFTLLVADTANHRVKAIRLNGEVEWILGAEGWKNGYFHNPLGMAVDGKGHVFVTEPRSRYFRGLGLDFAQRQKVQGNRLQVFDLNLNPSRPLGHMHRMSGLDYRQFKDISRVYVDPQGKIFLSDNGNHRVIRFSETFEKEQVYNRWPYCRLRYPNGIDGNAQGRLAICDTGHHRVLVLGTTGKIDQIVGGHGIEPGRFINPWEARFGPDHTLWVLDTLNCRIQIFREPGPPEPLKQPKVKKRPRLPALPQPPIEQVPQPGAFSF